MAPVTQRIRMIKSPARFIKPTSLSACQLKASEELYPMEQENISPAYMGLVVDYLTRFSLSGDKQEAFSISIKGATIVDTARKTPGTVSREMANKLLSSINGLDDDSISAAYKLVTFDNWVRNPSLALKYFIDDFSKDPNDITTKNIRIMVERCLAFFKKYGPIRKMNFTFEPNGYTETVSSGDGDYLTKDTLWDLKVSKHKPQGTDTLQLLMYWVMGQHSGQDIFKGITNVGIYNPRLNTVFTYNVSKLPSSIIKEVEDNVICY